MSACGINNRWVTIGFLLQIASILAIFAPSVQGQQPEAPAQLFTYSVIDTDSNWNAVLEPLKKFAIPVLDDAGATLYAIWVPVTIPESAPFDDLRQTQLVLMAAWPEGDDKFTALDSVLNALDGVTAVKTQVLQPIYLASGLTIPTETGFYVHREELYRPRDVDEVIRLSREAWETYEPTFGVRVIGLFRETNSSTEEVRLLRIAWYRSFEHWTESRQFAKDPQSLRRFRARSQLQLEGSGRAIATNRVVK